MDNPVIRHSNALMEQGEILDTFRSCGAFLEGHFILRSGRHSRVFFQCAKVLQYPSLAEKLCQALAKRIRDDNFTHVISPALGGLLVGHEIARALKKPHFFAEKKDGRFAVRRFEIAPGMKFLVAEDVVTTGSAVNEVIQIVREAGAQITGVACLVCRSEEEEVPDWGVPFYYLLRLPTETFSADELPADLRAVPAVKPGS